jgi:hypothetical protein
MQEVEKIKTNIKGKLVLALKRTKNNEGEN